MRVRPTSFIAPVTRFDILLYCLQLTLSDNSSDTESGVDSRLTYNGLLCCEHRTRLDSEDYWFGLYKETATPDGTTKWYDGNPSTYRKWRRGEPNDRTICIRYTKDGFSDRSCDNRYYYTCKKRAGRLALL